MRYTNTLTSHRLRSSTLYIKDNARRGRASDLLLAAYYLYSLCLLVDPRSASQPAMGNCLNAASKQRRGGLLPEEEESLSEMRRISQLLRDEEDAEYYSEETGEESPPPAAEVEAEAEGLKVKIVLTRAELEWLMAQLKTGDQRLEDVLHHMHAAKGAPSDTPQLQGGGGWRPRLESIIECPETTLVP